MMTILGLLSFFGLAGAAYCLIYRLLWNSAWEKPEAEGLSAQEKHGSDEPNQTSNTLVSTSSKSGAAGHDHQGHVILDRGAR